jgi:hypothetical protein
MADNYFEKSTVALGTIVTIVLLSILAAVVAFG